MGMNQMPEAKMAGMFNRALILIFVIVAANGCNQSGRISQQEYTRIQDAIDNSTDGDTIRVWEGVYYEHV